jgi:hypothetical protein
MQYTLQFLQLHLSNVDGQLGCYQRGDALDEILLLNKRGDALDRNFVVEPAQVQASEDDEEADEEATE